MAWRSSEFEGQRVDGMMDEERLLLFACCCRCSLSANCLCASVLLSLTKRRGDGRYDMVTGQNESKIQNEGV